MGIPLKKIFTIGVLHQQNFHEKRDIIFVNQACCVLVLCSILVFFCNLSFGFYGRSLVSLCAIPIFLFTLFLQNKAKYFPAKIILIIGAMSTGVFSTLIFGMEAKTQFYILASFILGMVLFSSRIQHIVLSLIHFVSFVFIVQYLEKNPSFIEGQDDVALAYFHVPLIFICGFITLSEYVVHYKKYEGRINQLMDSIKEKSELLQNEKTKYEVQSGMLQSANDLLVKEIEQREVVEQKLLSSNAELEQFAYVASHDLKEPLRTIGSFTQLIKKNIGPHFDKDSQIYYNYVVGGVQRMSSLLDDLLALSILNQEFEVEEVDIDERINMNLLNLHNAIEKNKGKVLKSKMPIINANEGQINQLFQNLISNGLKFKKEGVAPVVEIDCEEKETHYLFSVKDNGIGIKKEYAEKIFVIFQRLDKKTKYEGTGIGLAICKKIVQNHGGEIWIESTPGEGTTFFFTICKALEIRGNQVENDKMETVIPLNYN